MDNAAQLIELGKEKFGDLTKAEYKLFRAVGNGEIADYSAETEEENDPANAENWGSERTLKADRIAWLCTDKQASQLVTYKGIQAKGARIDGKLELQFANIAFPFYFESSYFAAEINLQNARLVGLNLPGTHTGPITADGLTSEAGIFLRLGFKAVGEVCLLGAKIGGDLDCHNGQFKNRGERALSASCVDLKGNVFLCQGFKAEGEVRLNGGIIGGVVDCTGGEFVNRQATAFGAEGIEVKGGVFLRDGFKGDGEICLLDATIGRTFDCRGGEFVNRGKVALNADRIDAKGGVFFTDGFRAEGEVRLVGSRIGSVISCIGAQFVNEQGRALSADGVSVKGGVFLRRGFRAEGAVRLVGASIEGDLECQDSQFVNPGGCALKAPSLKVGGDVYLSNGFRAHGQVNLVGGAIAGKLDCTGGHFVNEPGNIAVFANGLEVDHDVLMHKGFKAEGEVSLVSARIHQFFYWKDITSSKTAKLDLRSARIGTLRDEPKSWPETGKLRLHGLCYEQIHDGAPRDAQNRIDWLRRQPEYSPQPYEQLAAVLRKSGHEMDAKKILIAKNKDKARLTELTWSQWWWHYAFGPIIGYGYCPWRAFWIGMGFVILGSLLFGTGFRAKVMTPAKDGAYVSTGSGQGRALSEDYPKFSAFVYSLDVFVPLVDLHQASYWLPNANKSGELHIVKSVRLRVSGNLLRRYFWFQIIAGWVLTTLFVVGLTGLVRT